jgi:8-oxo-dGTP pyrophosphatase MutT (NUDIX family)
VRVKKRSAGVVVVRKAEDAWLFLLLRAYRNWDFPKGLIDAGEDPLDAAVRETREETSITDLAFPWGTGWIDTEPYAGGKISRYYLAETTQSDLVLPICASLGRPEHHEYRWFGFEDARSRLSPRLIRVIEWARERMYHPAAP